MSSSKSTIQRFTLGRSLQALRLESSHLIATVLLDQGGDILELIHKPTKVDVLWKVPYPVREHGVGPTPGGDSYQQWIHYYRGGWQTIFPNYGPAASYRGSCLDFHGEAARRPWTVAFEEADNDVVVELTTTLASLPFCLRRHIHLSGQQPRLSIRETVYNYSDSPVDCMWAHHPVFGSPLLSAQSRIYTGARKIHIDPNYDPAGNDLPSDGVFDWPVALRKDGTRVDLSRTPAPGSGVSRVMFLKEFEEPWCAIVNPTIPLGVAIRWNADLMKYLCIWQEAGGERDFPHFGSSYATALEPSATLFGHGLVDAMEKTATHLTVDANASETLRLSATLFEDTRQIDQVDAEGNIAFAD